MLRQSKQGFSLIELMIVVAIIGILAAIVYPSYSQYTIRTKRADVQKEMLRVAQLLQSYKMVNKDYSGASFSIAGGSGTTQNYPSSGRALYTLSLSVSSDMQTYRLTATPIAATPQAGNGIICLNDQGQKFWAKAATTCSLSSTSDWTGR